MQTHVQVSSGDVDIAFVKKTYIVGVCIDEKLDFIEHVRRICSKASGQISSLQVNYPNRKGINISLKAFYFNCVILQIR